VRAIHSSDAIVVDEMPTAQEKQEKLARKSAQLASPPKAADDAMTDDASAAAVPIEEDKYLSLASLSLPLLCSLLFFLPSVTIPQKNHGRNGQATPRTGAIPGKHQVTETRAGNSHQHVF
jgi:hypothetical protein